MKTYSERRQQAYFRAAVELYKLVVEIAEENIDNPPEGAEHVSQANLTWAASLVESTYRKGRDLEDRGHEECIASQRQESWLTRNRAAAEARTGDGRRLKAAILKKLG